MRHPLVIRPSVGHIAMPSDTNELLNTDFVRALLGATIAYADYKEACMSLEEILMRCYGSCYEVTFLVLYCFIVLSKVSFKVWKVDLLKLTFSRTHILVAAPANRILPSDPLSIRILPTMALEICNLIRRAPL